MLWMGLLVGWSGAEVPLEELGALAAARDVAGLQRFVTPNTQDRVNFDFLRTGGVYGGGRAGWTVHPLVDPVGGSTHIVFSTPLSCEDIGEQVYRWSDGGFGPRVPELESFGLRLRHQELTVQFEPKDSKVKILAEPRFTVEGRTSPTFHLRIDPRLSVRSVRLKGGGEVPYAQAAGTISLATPPQRTFQLEMVIEGSVGQRGQEGTVNDREVILSGMCWWPSLARQASSSRVTVLTPPQWRAFSHGTKETEAVENGVRRTVWVNRIPVSVFSLTAGEYVVVSEKRGKWTLWSAEVDGDRDMLALQNELNFEVVRALDEFHPWPYPAWGSVISEHFPGGALEAYSFATYAKGWLPELEPHEPSHTYWGGLIPNTYLRSLWNESLATYFEGFVRREGMPGNRSDLRWIYREIPNGLPAFRAVVPIMASAEAGPAASTVGYRYGGLILDMLEDEIGVDALRRAMQSWLREHPRGRTGEWEDFMRHLLAASGRDLRWFFDQWLRRAGYPEFEVETSVGDWTPSGYPWTTQLRFTGAPYRIRLDALVRYEDGTSARIRLPLTSGQSAVRIEQRLPKRPKSITYDPLFRIVRNIDSRAQPSTLARSIRGKRIWAMPGYEGQAQALFGRAPQRVDERLPENPSEWILVGDPRENAELAKLWARIEDGPEWKGKTLSWRGQSVSSGMGGFAALVTLDRGARCIVAWGTSRVAVNWGLAESALFDDLGRVRAGRRAMANAGALHFDLLPDPIETAPNQP